MNRLASGHPSSTAFAVALRRAAHQLIDQPRVFEDPLALRIIGSEGLKRLHDDPSHEAPWSRTLRAYMAARSRFAEDCLADAYDRGVRQYLVLGAGLDTYGCRNPHADLTVFEADHPATQAWKIARLDESGLEPGPSLVFAPIDFARQGLAEGLAAAGFDADQPAFVSWLGVSMYLTADAVEQTLAYVARLPSGSEVVFDFRTPPELLDPLTRAAVSVLAGQVAAAGEPFRSAFIPAALAVLLGALGFYEIDTLDAADLNQLYFKARSDGLRIIGSANLAVARV